MLYKPLIKYFNLPNRSVVVGIPHPDAESTVDGTICHTVYAGYVLAVAYDASVGGLVDGYFEDAHGVETGVYEAFALFGGLAVDAVFFGCDEGREEGEGGENSDEVG